MDDDVLTITINSKEIINNIKLSEQITDVKYIPLETNDNCLIGQWIKVAFWDNDIYVWDHDATKRVYRFSKEGKFLNSIGRVGQVPCEYLDPTDNRIAVYNRGGKDFDEDKDLVLFDKSGNEKQAVFYSE